MGEKSTEGIRCAVMHGMYDPFAAGAQFDRWLKQVKAEAWDEAAEATAEWMANNPSPSGVPHDPPSNPYREQEK